MRNVLRITTECKIQPVRQRVLDATPAVEDQASLVALIQAVIPLGLPARRGRAGGRSDETGERYSRTGGQPGVVCWGQQAGAVYLLDQKLPIVYSVRDLARKREVPLSTYEQLKILRVADAGLFRKVLHGLSCRRYAACASSVSRRFIRASAKALEQFSARRLEQDDVVVLVLDGKTFAEDSMGLAVGILRTGEKKLLGVVQTATENETTCAALLRGLRTDHGLLCVIDGAKGLRRAMQTVFGCQAVVQRCQWHMRQNVLAYLPKGPQASWRRRLQQAYERPTYAEARAALLELRRELRLLNRSAAASLEEGLEDTLPLHRLGVFDALGHSLKTTNCLESINAQLGQLTDKVDRWRTSEQTHRWVASAFVEIEPRLRRIKGYRHLPQLRAALQAKIGKAERLEGTLIA